MYKIGDKVILNKDTIFMKGFNAHLIKSGTKVEIIDAFKYCNNNLYEIEFKNITTVVNEHDINSIYKFKIGDKVKILSLDLEGIIEKQCVDCNKIQYAIKNINFYIYEDDLELIQDITDKIKTFEDAYTWCCKHNKINLTNQFDIIYFKYPKKESSIELKAYLMLRIITAALNEGWELTNSNGNTKAHIVAFSCTKNSLYVSTLLSIITTSNELLFKSKELAEYASKQFHDIYINLYKK